MICVHAVDLVYCCCVSSYEPAIWSHGQLVCCLVQVSNRLHLHEAAAAEIHAQANAGTKPDPRCGAGAVRRCLLFSFSKWQRQLTTSCSAT